MVTILWKNVPEDAVITFSYIGMIPQEIAVKGKNVINVQLKDDVQKLEEVVVIGYGSAKAKDLTSPITVVKGGSVTFYSRLFTYGCHARESGRSKCNQ